MALICYFYTQIFPCRNIMSQQHKHRIIFYIHTTSPSVQGVLPLNMGTSRKERMGK